MKHRTDTLDGDTLDWAVHRELGTLTDVFGKHPPTLAEYSEFGGLEMDDNVVEQILQRYPCSVVGFNETPPCWQANVKYASDDAPERLATCYGSTPRQALFRALVKSVHGEEVEL